MWLMFMSIWVISTVYSGWKIFYQTIKRKEKNRLLHVFSFFLFLLLPKQTFQNRIFLLMNWKLNCHKFKLERMWRGIKICIEKKLLIKIREVFVKNAEDKQNYNFFKVTCMDGYVTSFLNVKTRHKTDIRKRKVQNFWCVIKKC